MSTRLLWARTWSSGMLRRRLEMGDIWPSWPYTWGFCLCQRGRGEGRRRKMMVFRGGLLQRGVRVLTSVILGGEYHCEVVSTRRQNGLQQQG